MSERQGLRRYLSAFSRLSASEKAKVIASLCLATIWLFLAVFFMVYSLADAELFPELKLDPRLSMLLGAVISAFFPWIYNLTRVLVSSSLAPLMKLTVERMHILPHDEFVAKYKGDPRFRGAFTVIEGAPVGIVEEHPGELRDLDEVVCEIHDASEFYVPELLRLMVEPFWDTLKELARKEGIATWYQLKARVRSWSPTHMTLEGVSYLDAFVFHYAPDTTLGKKTLREILWPLVMRDGKLVPLNYSLFPNHLGVHILVVTRDGKMLVSRRSVEVAVAKKALAPSVEGTVNLPWSSGRRTLASLAEKEVYYELSLSPEDYRAFLISLARGTYVMGRPSAFVLLLTELTSDELRSRTPIDRWEAADYHFEDLGVAIRSLDDMADPKVIERLRAILRRYVEQKASPTLLFAMGRLIAQLEARST